ncbi:MAG: class C beta-lactamase-related serine hydrolase [Cytophagales bacterium]|nr:MAG: class C beta-lactamase-related serine hydrolase [Cytophagales bacterium]
MSTTKKIVYGMLLLFGIFLIYFVYTGLQYAYIASSYAAKTVCSCVFVSGREPDAVLSEDLYAAPFVKTEIDQDNKSVSTNLYGFAAAKAIFRKGLGCTLVNELTETEIRQQTGLQITDKLPESLVKVQMIPPTIDSAALFKAIDLAFQEKDTSHIIRTRAITIFYKGQLLAEKYGKGITENTPLLGWSMTKSVTNAMIGLLVKDGKIDISKPAPIAEWKDDERKQITTDQLLRMSSGLDFEEIYSLPSDATQMLFRKKGAGAYALLSKQRAKPDQEWYYSSGTSNILQEIARRQFGSQADYLAFPHLRLFQKIGMKSAVLEPDASGTYVGSSFMYATGRDWAKFGQLYLQDGIWNGERLLPEGWVKYSATETPLSKGTYAAQFWLNHNDKNFPQDAFMALGFEGQSVTIVPSKELVIVRLGCTPNENDFDRNQFIKSIVATVK